MSAGNKHLYIREIIADDQTEVSTKLQELIDTYDIKGDDVYHHTITGFGLNKFLITIMYYDYLWMMLSKAVGLKASFVSKILIKKALSATLGFKSALGRLKFTTKFAKTIGFSLANSKKLVVKKGFSATFGLGPAVEWELISPTHPFKAFGLKAVLATFKIGRAFVQTIGLKASLSTIKLVTVGFSKTIGLVPSFTGRINYNFAKTLGLKIGTISYSFVPADRAFNKAIGLSVNWEASYNGVPIIL